MTQNQLEFIKQAKAIRDVYAEKVQVLDSTRNRNRCDIREMYKERRVELDALWLETEKEVDRLRAELLDK